MDQLVDADNHWNSYFVDQSVWVYADEYRAELPGDRDYCRIIVTAGDSQGWYYERSLSERQQVLETLESLQWPLSEHQLGRLNFRRWRGESII
jgi:hypothetical protein|tara:strand:+ start:4700 stop:4978 length:279 start_codon:yes stop_codon:yes gene_type:complete